MKTCSICHTDKPLVEFHAFKNKASRTGVYHLSWCKPCHRDKSRAFHAANPAHSMVRSAKKRAKAKDLPFDITVDDISIPSHCPALGIPLVVGSGGKHGPTVASPSIDRIRPELGYVKGNVIVVSLLANAIKTSGTPAQIIAVGEFYRDLEMSE